MRVQCEQRRELTRELTVVEIGHAKVDASSPRVLCEFGGARSTVPAARVMPQPGATGISGSQRPEAAGGGQHETS